ncbi:hypothetical protein QFC24_007113 [Naganishia onofrii]|uniref:Uncharacterized protein n=1 Tax=Naganishia onofrii TaxID=1851511 RepID=A0ACC2WSN7_9TREE|nr:hypothetical protein QFC24_007113 [Naganishia onofrii]
MSSSPTSGNDQPTSGPADLEDNTISASAGEEYSPFRPHYDDVDGDFWNFISPEAVQEGRLCPSANVNVVNVDPFDFNVPELDGDNDAPSPFHFDAGTPPEWVVPHSPGFLTWYQKELGMGNLDNVILSDAFCATPPLDQSRAPFQDQAPLDVPTLLRLLEQARAAEALDKGNDTAGPSSVSLDDYHVPVPVEQIPSPAATIDPRLLFDKAPPLDGDGDDQPHTTTILLDNRDLNDVSTLLDVDTQFGDDYDTVTATTDGDDDEDITSDDVIRHFWSRDGDLRYWVMVGGTRLHLTAEQLDDQVYGARVALWTYWQQRQPGDIDVDCIIRHLRRMGHAGFFREMLWHLLPSRMRRMLYKLRKEGKLDLFFF